MKKFELPKEFRGISTKEAYERVINSKAPVEEPLSVPANIDPKQYIQVPQHKISIATRETHLDKNMYDTLDALSGEGLKMPSPLRFMTHWRNIHQAAEGKRTLLYADGTPVERDSAVDLWNYMSSTDRKPFNEKPCWTWLNALFEEENGIMHMVTDLRTITQGQEKSLAGTRVALDSFLETNGWADLKLNKQGLPIQPSNNNNYIQGENIYFWKPVNGKVARFVANSNRAGLDCGWYPVGRYSSLGVFAVADAVK